MRALSLLKFPEDYDLANVQLRKFNSQYKMPLDLIAHDGDATLKDADITSFFDDVSFLSYHCLNDVALLLTIGVSVFINYARVGHY